MRLLTENQNKGQVSLKTISAHIWYKGMGIENFYHYLYHYFGKFCI